jgi:hypothetical protein
MIRAWRYHVHVRADGNEARHSPDRGGFAVVRPNWQAKSGPRLGCRTATEAPQTRGTSGADANDSDSCRNSSASAGRARSELV